MDAERWPALQLSGWRDTYATLHMWTQVVGKLALTTTPLENHWWNVAFRLTANGFATRPMTCGDACTLDAAFDFIAHELRLHASTGATAVLKLEPKTVASFYAEVVAALARLRAPIAISTLPSEVADPVRFEEDTGHRAYDARWANAFWRALDAMRPVFEEFRCRFVGKCSPLHFFWGSFDLALSRFSGRSAPANPNADAVMREAYSHEVISHGFWPGGSGFEEPAFYAYAAPQPAGLGSARVQPAAARYDTNLNEFLLPYEAVRVASSPEAELMLFLETTYEQAAGLAHWERRALER
jgi:hypothetical protein